jgi:hypothetical protein
MDILSMIFGFIVGAAIGGLIAHSWGAHDKQEAISKLNNLFDRLWNQHTHLLKEMKSDMENPDFKFQREFYVIKKKQRFSLSIPNSCLVYYLDEHDGLEDQLKDLESSSFISNATEPNKHNFTKYQFSENFVGLLRNKKI